MFLTNRYLIFLGTILVSLTYISTMVSSLEEADCPVCFSVVNKLRADIEEDEKASMTAENISTAFLHLCDMAKKDSVESKFCYYLGGQDVSATRTYKDMADKMAWGLPTHKVCEHLKLKDGQVCEIREKKPIDLKTVDPKKLKTAEMKRILRERGESCDNCFEKSEFVKKIEEIKAREEL